MSRSTEIYRGNNNRIRCSDIAAIIFFGSVTAIAIAFTYQVFANHKLEKNSGNNPGMLPGNINPHLISSPFAMGAGCLMSVSSGIATLGLFAKAVYKACHSYQDHQALAVDADESRPIMPS